MAHEPQDKQYTESRSGLGSMSFAEIRKWTGIDVNPDEGMNESGTAENTYGPDRKVNQINIK